MNNFENAITLFLREQNHVKKLISLKEILHSPSSRLLFLENLKGEQEIYVIKVPYIGKMKPSKSWVFYLENEILVQSFLSDLGFLVKKYLLYDICSDMDKCFSIATYLPGPTLKELNQESLKKVVPLVLDYLFKIHSTNFSKNYGYILNKFLLFKGLSVGESETLYLRSDMRRDGIVLTKEEEGGLVHVENLLNSQRGFCFCHCDVTLRNTLWDGCNVHLIDWAYSRFTHPAHDIAYVIFWLCEEGLEKIATEEFLRAQQKYRTIGFELDQIFFYYFAQRCIEFGRIRGEKYINRGKQILANIRNYPIRSFECFGKFK
jgi:hypothetical protein